MAHTYVIQSVVADGTYATILGTVDGIPVKVTTWKSSVTSFASAILAMAFIANLMLAVAFPPATTTLSQYQGTITQ
jgi:hypothetical protein